MHDEYHIIMIDYCLAYVGSDQPKRRSWRRRCDPELCSGQCREGERRSRPGDVVPLPVRKPMLTPRASQINSWSRLPFITPLRNGTNSILPLRRIIRGNLILGTYSSQECVDNDDGYVSSSCPLTCGCVAIRWHK
jgi:hypothetical protein